MSSLRYHLRASPPLAYTLSENAYSYTLPSVPRYRIKYRSFIPMVTLAIWSLGGGGIFLAIEKNISIDINPNKTSSPSLQGCLRFHSFWTAVSYCNAVVTTIGYGNVYCCTDVGRALTILYAMIGIPLSVISLNNIGNELADLFEQIYKPLGRCLINSRLVRKRRKTLPVNGVAAKWEGADDVPLSMVFLLNVVWCLLFGCYIWGTEDRLTYWESVYSAFITLTTVGFGDYPLRKANYTVASYFLIYVGLAFLSMSLKLVQRHLETALSRVASQVKVARKKHALRRKFDSFLITRGISIDQIQKEDDSIEEVLKENSLAWLQYLFDAQSSVKQQLAQSVFSDCITTVTDGGPTTSSRSNYPVYNHNSKPFRSSTYF